MCSFIRTPATQINPRDIVVFVDLFMKLAPGVSALYAGEEIRKAVGARGDESSITRESSRHNRTATHTNVETLW